MVPSCEDAGPAPRATLTLPEGKPMRSIQTLATATPALALLGLIWLGWREVEACLIYAPAFLLVIPVLSLLPLIALLVWQSRAEVTKPPHPFAVVLPAGVLLVVLLLPVGARVASAIPWFCVAQSFDEVKPDRPGKAGPEGRFILDAHGWGNSFSYEFRLVTVMYAVRDRRFDDLYVRLPEWQCHYTNSYTTNVPLTRGKLVEYVERSDDFPPGVAEAVADKMWELLRNYKERRDIPPMGDGTAGPNRASRSWLRGENVYLAAALLSTPLLLTLSWFLSGRHRRGGPTS
jgi:hypothetical protein